MKIYIIRHGQTTGDIEDRYGGDYDDHLTPLGMEQATKMAEVMADKGIEIIYCSPLIRAQETAKVLQSATGVEVKTVKDLKERNQNGILTGMIRSEAKIKYPELTEQVNNPYNTIEGAENFDDFRKRVVKSVNEIAGSGFETVAVITHGGPIRRIMNNILSLTPDAKIADCGWLLVEYKDGKFELVKSEGITF